MQLSLPLILLAACAPEPTEQVEDSGFVPTDTDTNTDTATPTPLPPSLNVVQDATVPPARSGVLSAPHIGSDQIMVFGGNTGEVVGGGLTTVLQDDTWVFEPRIGWSQITTESAPSRRERYAVVVDEQGARALLFGGRSRAPSAPQTADYQLHNDLWAFSFVDRTWTQLTAGDPNGPPARYATATAWDEDSGTLYLWGGTSSANPFSTQLATDLWSYQDGTWTEIPTSGNPPSSRGFFASTWDPTRKRIVVFGGHPGDFQSQSFNSLHALDVTTGAWSELHQGSGSVYNTRNDGSIRESPSTRLSAHMAYDDLRDRYLVWGGRTDIGDLNDLWAFDPTLDVWEVLHIGDTLTRADLGCGDDPVGVPSSFVEQDLLAPERRHRGVFALMHDSLWISQGLQAECRESIDDTWRYDLEDNVWFELIEATSGQSCARRGESCDCLCL